jgi:hypothetical protein
MPRMARLDHRRAITGAALICGAAAVAGFAGGCSSHQAGKAAAPQTAAAGSPATDMDRLAAAAGCKITGLRSVKDLRQGVCQTPSGHYTILTFSTDQGRNVWLGEAKRWGGAYLVGKRWVAVGTVANLSPLKSRLGGVIQPGDKHH